uniref:Uncharacterized protein n=1 Tax=viral metagenome TaxID=1070528 RepID=A0A2V0RJY0_9ZZZZ
MAASRITRAETRKQTPESAVSDPPQLGIAEQPQGSVAELERTLQNKITSLASTKAQHRLSLSLTSRPTASSGMIERVRDNVHNSGMKRHLQERESEIVDLKRKLAAAKASISRPVVTQECSNAMESPPPVDLSGDTSVDPSPHGPEPVETATTVANSQVTSLLSRIGAALLPELSPQVETPPRMLFGDDVQLPEVPPVGNVLMASTEWSRPPPVVDRVISLGMVKSHALHNHEIHALVGNTTPTAAPGAPSAPGEVCAGVVPSRNPEFRLGSRTLEDGTIVDVHPGRAIALKQWAKYGPTVWRGWWTAIGVQGGGDPFSYFPATIQFAGGTKAPKYTKDAWSNLVPFLTFNVDGARFPYNGEPGVDLETGSLSWVWPPGELSALAILNGLGKNELDSSQVKAVFAQTPALTGYVKNAYAQIKASLTRILNKVTARRDPRFNDVKKRYADLMLTQARIVESAKNVYLTERQKLIRIQTDRDAELRALDPNLTGGMLGVEDQLDNLGIDLNPLPASAGQKGQSEPPRPVVQPVQPDASFAFMDDDE